MAQVVGLALWGREALVEYVVDPAVVQGVLGLKLVSTHTSTVAGAVLPGGTSRHN